MSTRDDFFEKLFASPLYRSARNGFKTDVEKKQLDAFIVEKFCTIVETLAKIEHMSEIDAGFREDLRLAVEGRDRVVINETATNVSGSHG